MRLVIDSNRLIAALLRSSTNRSIILSDQFDLFAPDLLQIEVEKHREYLERKANVRKNEFDEILSILLERITLVPFFRFSNAYEQALTIMKAVDEDDAPFLALALQFDLDGIWTEDKDFLKQNAFPVYSTKNLLDIIE